jgi:DNA polymerase-3 subunit epsilon
MQLDRLAFIDLETSGPSPARDRIVEIGVVLVDEHGLTEWGTLLAPDTRARDRAWDRPKYAASPESRPPRFQDIAPTLATLLEGRLVIAHNARFDYNFLRCEFARIRQEFQPRVLCSLMLSRRLYPHCARHDLDSIAERHGLTSGVRHRALPDADLVRQFWAAARCDHSESTLALAVEELIAQPVYPAHLDAALIERLPESAGIYVLYDSGGTVLDAGAACNVKRHVQDYFRVDCLSPRARTLSHRVADIRCKTTRGLIGAQLELVTRPEWIGLRGRTGADLHSWRLTPECTPSLSVNALDDALLASGQSYGVFRSSRRARNALRRLAVRHRLCFTVLGIGQDEGEACTRCLGETVRPPCMGKAGRLRELTRAATAIGVDRNPPWPFEGPVGLRERGMVHVLDRWRYLGSAASDAELRALLSADSPAPTLSEPMYRLTRRLVERHAHRLMTLHGMVGRWNEERGSLDPR